MPYVKNKPWIMYSRKDMKKNTIADVAHVELTLENKN